MEPLEANTINPAGSASLPSDLPNVSPVQSAEKEESLTMAPAPRENDSNPRNLRSTPNRSSIESPRLQASGRGGCWTCRVRRKKCDEQWQDDSCSTCKRLEIDCLGWGPRRPEWLRNKNLVARYRAQITETLTRAGRIRGQPRTIRRPSGPTQNHPREYQRGSTESTSLDPREQSNTYRSILVEEPYRPNIMYPPMIDSLNGSFPPTIPSSDAGPLYYPETSSASTYHTPDPYSSFSIESDLGQEDFTGGFIPPIHSPLDPSDGYIAYFSHYFNHVRSLQPMLGGTRLADVTNSLITRDPNGAVAKAVCALSSLHMGQIKVSQGLEPLEPTMDHGTATYFRNEAFFLINRSQHLHGCYTDSDAIAALHLVSFSQLSGGQFPWHDAYAIMCDRVIQSTLPATETPCLVYDNMPPVSQYVVKATLSLDVFASLSTGQPPKFLELMKRLLGNEIHRWPRDGGDLQRIRMENFAGLPNNILLGIAEINALSHWKLTEISQGTLSYRKLVHRGEAIEQLLRDQSFIANAHKEEEPTAGSSSVIEIGEETQNTIVDMFREGAIQYLNSVISGYNPDVPEIKESAKAVLRSLYRLQPSVIDQTLVFPAVITACLTSDLNQREFLKSRLHYTGHFSQICVALDSVWRTRETGAFDIQEAVKDAGLLLV